MLICQRAGVKRFFIQAGDPGDGGLRTSLGSFGDYPEVNFVGSFAEILEQLPADAPCIALKGNLVLAASQLRGLLESQAARPGEVVSVGSTDAASGGIVAAGPLGRLIEGSRAASSELKPSGQLPFALDGRPADVQEAEVRLAREVRRESADKDALMARWVDRRLSWRISLRLARTAITPNQVTLANTALGLVSALLFSCAGYWPRLIAALMFLVSVTFDGVDGELARLKMTESPMGRAARRDDRQPGACRDLRRHHDRMLPGERQPSLFLPACHPAGGLWIVRVHDLARDSRRRRAGRTVHRAS